MPSALRDIHPAPSFYCGSFWRPVPWAGVTRFNRRGHDRGIASQYEKSASGALRLARTGHLAPMATERELLDQVGERLGKRRETHFHPPIDTDRRHVAEQAQRFDQGLAQVDLELAGLAHRRRGILCPPDGR